MEFIPGLQLSQIYYKEVIQPIMKADFPKIQFAAGRLDWGSDVLGFDTPMSMDHGWGPRLQIFINEEDFIAFQERLDHHFAYNLPFEVNGFPTNFGEPYSDGGVMLLKEEHPIHHQVSITTPERFFSNYLGLEIHQPLTPEVWLTLPQQKLRTIRAGQVYHDGLGRINEIRKYLHWYPQDIWVYILANQWQRIDQDEPFIGRTGHVGDELGSRLLSAGVIRDLINLAFLIEREYAPYKKWFSAAFKQLKIAPLLLPIFSGILDSKDWQTREILLSKAYKLMADAHNTLNLTSFIRPEVNHFHERPFLVPHASRFVDALLNEINDPDVKLLPPHLGSINQIVDNTDILESNPRCQKLMSLYWEDNQTK